MDEGQLRREREHLRELLELTNAVSTRDVASLAAAIAPNLRRIVARDDVGLFFLDPAGEQMGRYALTAHGVGWTDELTAELRPDKEPFATWLAAHRTVDIDVEQFDWRHVVPQHLEMYERAVQKIRAATPARPVAQPEPLLK